MGRDLLSQRVQRARDKVLVVLLCETRAWELTADSFTSNVLDELDADLALCVGDREAPNPLYERAKYVWQLEEPDDWAEAYDRRAGNGKWRVLLELQETLLGPIDDPEFPQRGSGGIVLYFREFLRQSAAREGIADAYDWLVVTRSDFLWPIPHPHVRHLSDRDTYALDGEHYGGICDRHFIVPRRHVAKFLSLPSPVFEDPLGLKREIDRIRALEGWPLMGPERLLCSLLMHRDLWRTLRFLPYAAYTVRAEGGSTRWSKGVFDEELGYYVKYPAEKELSEVTRRFIGDQAAWARYLSPVRGLPTRLRLRLAYPRQGSRRRGSARIPSPLRPYRWLRWVLRRRYDQRRPSRQPAQARR